MRSVHSIPPALRLIGLLHCCLFAGMGSSASAQNTDSTATDPPTCAPGTAEAYLDIGNVRAKILNVGGLFWNGGQPVYEVPKGGGVNAIFAAGLWLGGMVGDDLRVAATTYAPWEFWPGPIDGPLPSPERCAEYDRIWEVRARDLRKEGGTHERVRTWPVHAGAPFIDTDGDGAYRPDRGDRPQLFGDQQQWWIMNDAGGIHRSTDAEPLNVEIRATAFAFNTPGAVGNSTFYRFLIRNTSSETIRKSYAGFWKDTDLGAAYDDYIGSDSTLGMGYSYNADNDDNDQYGMAPPAIGFTVLKRPSSTVNNPGACDYPDDNAVGFTNVMHYWGGAGIVGDPQTGSDFYNFLQSQWKDGRSLTMGGSGMYFSNIPTRFVFPGDPVTGSYWSELNPTKSRYSNSPYDKRFLSSLGPFCLAPGEEVELVIAIVWSRGSSNLDSVRQLREDVAYIQSIRDAILTPRALPGGGTPAAAPELPFAVSVYPNPVGGAGGGASAGGGGRASATVRFSTPEPLEVSVTVFNALGQRVHVAAEPGMVQAGDHTWTLPTSAWPPGVYLVRITAGHAVTTRRLVIT